MDFEAYLDDLPLLHSWDFGKTWNTGGFQVPHLRKMHEVVTKRFDKPRICEVGAGNSTLTFLHTGAERVVCVAPEHGLHQRIVDAADARGIDRSHLDYRVALSERELPKLAFDEEALFDVALIDGGHGWPNVFVDFCYLNAMLRAGGLLLIDDNQIYAIAELSRLLDQQDGFTHFDTVGKLEFWEKSTDDPFLPGHNLEPYIMEMSKTRPR